MKFLKNKNSIGVIVALFVIFSVFSFAPKANAFTVDSSGVVSGVRDWLPETGLSSALIFSVSKPAEGGYLAPEEIFNPQGTFRFAACGNTPQVKIVITATYNGITKVVTYTDTLNGVGDSDKVARSGQFAFPVNSPIFKTPNLPGADQRVDFLVEVFNADGKKWEWIKGHQNFKIMTRPVPVISANPNPVVYGGSTALLWSVPNDPTSAANTAFYNDPSRALSCTGSGDWSGSKIYFDASSATPKNFTGAQTETESNITSAKTYNLQCFKTYHSINIPSNPVSVTVGITYPAPTATLTANPASVETGHASTLTWSSTNVTACVGNGFSTSGNTSGNISTGALATTTSYSVICTGAGGSATSSAMVVVTTPPPPPPPPPAPTATLVANPTSFETGHASTLTWSSTNATMCVGTNFSTSGNTSGNISTGALTASTTYSIICTGAGGSATSNATVIVTALPPPPPPPLAPTATLTANPTSVLTGHASTLTWSSTNATTCVGNGFSTSGNTSGNVSTGALTATTTYSIICTGAGGNATDTAMVAVVIPVAPVPPTAHLVANPTSVETGHASTLTWSSTNAISCLGTKNFSTGSTSPTSGSTSTGPLTVTTGYSLLCIGTGGTATDYATVTVTSLPPPPPVLEGSCSVNPATANISEPITFTALATGGTGTYSYAWAGDPNITGSNASIQVSYPDAGTKSLSVHITSGAQSITKTCNVTISVPVIPTGCITIHKEAYNENDVAITSVPTFAFNIDGTSGNTVYNDNTGVVTVSGLSVGNHTVTETTPNGWTNTSVIPANGAVTVAAGNTCADISFKNKQNPVVIPDIIGSCSASPSAVYVGDSVTYTAAATGGTGTFTYSWAGDDGLTGVNQSVQTSYNSAGTKNAHVTITSGSKTVTKDCSSSVSEHNQPLNGSCSANPGTALTGATITYTASATGGTTTVPYTYTWGGDDGLSGSSQSVQKSYATSGNKNATVTITSDGESINRSCSSIITEPVVNQTGCIVVTKEARDANDVLITPTPAFTFTLDGAGSYTTNTSGTVQIPNLSVGSHTIAETPVTGWTLQSTTPTGGVVNVSAGSSCAFVTFKNKQNSAGPSPIVGSCSASPATAHVGDQITYTAVATGGTGVFGYAWTGDQSLSGSATSTQITYSATGTKNASVTITSAASSTVAQCSSTITDANVVIPLAVTCAPNVTTTTVGSTVTFTASPSGGNGSYQFSWSGDDSISGTATTTSHTYTTVGTKLATTTVTSNGETKSAQCSVQVNAVPPPPPPPPPGGTNWGYQISTIPTTPTTVTVVTETPAPQVAGVFLSQVPSTGLGDNLKVASFIFGLFGFSLWFAYTLIKRKSRALAVLGIDSSANIAPELSQVVADPRLESLRANKNELMELLEYRAREQRAIVSAPALEMIMEKATEQKHTALSMLDSAIAIYSKGRDEIEHEWTTLSTDKITAVLQSL